eukprot:2092693-Rhodomonas_salina.1
MTSAGALVGTLTPTAGPEGIEASAFAVSFALNVTSLTPRVVSVSPELVPESGASVTVQLADLAPVAGAGSLSATLGGAPVSVTGVLFSDAKGTGLTVAVPARAPGTAELRVQVAGLDGEAAVLVVVVSSAYTISCDGGRCKVPASGGALAVELEGFGSATASSLSAAVD